MWSREKIGGFIDFVNTGDDYDETQYFGGIKPDAPQEAKNAYEAFVKEEDALKQNGIIR